jgi:hypothetical protein
MVKQHECAVNTYCTGSNEKYKPISEASDITPLKIPYPFARLFDSITQFLRLPKTLSHPMQQHGNNLFKQLYTLNQSPSCNAYI